ncbi:MAG: transcriptional regulator, TetR family, partial [Frankiales bacterium]|nr:transcriptional regulator, TetR family [Frankiales bacterium]
MTTQTETHLTVSVSGVSAESTVDNILEAAARALSRHGARKLSMSDICLEAQVSRGTLYRYFSSKDDVLEALGQHVLVGIRQALQDAVDAEPALDRRVRIVLEALYHLGESAPYAGSMVASEPGFALSFFSRSMPTYVSILDEFLAPALLDVPAVAEGRLTTAQVSELLERLVLSTWLLRDPADTRVLERVAASWDALVRASGRPVLRAVAPLDDEPAAAEGEGGPVAT